MEESESIQLGGGIQLSGFGDLDPGTLVIVKKIVGNFVKKLDNSSVKLHLTLKPVHKTEQSQKYEIMGRMEVNNEVKRTEIVDFNLFFALNKVLNKLK